MIRHFTKSGKELKTVKGIVIKPEEYPDIYQMVANRTKRNRSKHEETNKEQSH